MGDPYHSPYLSELSLFIEPLRLFKQKIDFLLCSWPDNAILQRLKELTEKLEALPLSAPLMKWLIGLETLLGKADEWEVVASSEVSIKNEMHGLSRFVVRWRKLELESWSTVLDRRLRDSRKKTAQWWFNLHELVETACKDPFWLRNSSDWIKKGNAKDNMINDSAKVFQTLDQFARSSTLSDFTFRCNLLLAFAWYVRSHVGRSDVVLATTLQNLSLYYQQFIPHVEKYLESSRQPIQKKLTDHVKIATWDDRNYFSLRESAEKSHRVVLKLARAFDEILESPAHPAVDEAATSVAVFNDPQALANAPPLKAKENEKTEKSMNEYPHRWLRPFQSRFDITPSSLMSFQSKLERDLPHIVNKARTLIEKQALPALENRTQSGGRSALELDCDARERLLSLSKESPSQLKKRALLDFLSRLKSHSLFDGITPQQIKDPRLVLASRIQVEGLRNQLVPACLPKWAQVDDSFFTCLSQLTRLRQVISSPDRSQDISSVECNRGMKVCDAIMVMLLTHRQIMNALPESIDSLRHGLELWEGLCSIDNFSKLCLFLPDESARAELKEDFDFVLRSLRDLNFLVQKIGTDKVGIDLHRIESLQLEFATWSKREIGERTSIEDFFERLREETNSVYNASKKVVMSQKIPSCEPLIEKLKILLGKSYSISEWGKADTSNEEGSKSINLFVQSCMLFVQATLQSDVENPADFENMVNHNTWLVCTLQNLNIAQLVARVQDVTSNILRGGVEKDALLWCMQLLNNLVTYLERFTNSFLSFHFSLCRFEQFILSVFRTLCDKGFCKPPDEEENDGEGGNDGENMREGTGMGEGVGQKNVSDEIEEEEQILGLRGENEQQENNPKEPDQEKNQEEDKGIEMENDFEGGDMHDVEPEDDEKNEDDNEDDAREEEEEEELDREMGDAGEQSQVVDEKLWENEDEKEQPDKDEKYEKNAPMKGRDEDDEMRAKSKEDEENDDDASVNSDKREPAGKPKPKKDDMNQNEEGDDNNDDDETSVLNNEQTEENHDIDIKEDNFEEEENEEGIPEEDTAEDNSKEPEDFEMPENDAENDAEDDRDDGEDNNEASADEHDTEGNDNENAARAEKEDEQDLEEQNQLPDSKLSLPATNELEQDPNQKDESANDQQEKTGNSQGQGSSSASQENEVSMQLDESPPKGGLSNQSGSSQGGSGGERYRKGAEEREDENDDQKNNTNNNSSSEREPNPWKDPGDASREWTRRLKIVENGVLDQGEEEEQNETLEDNQTVEYNKKKTDEADDKFNQTLGPREEGADKNELTIEEDEQQEEEEEKLEKQPKRQEKDSSSNNQEPAKIDKPNELRRKEKPKKSPTGFFDDLEESDNDEESDNEKIEKEDVVNPSMLSEEEQKRSHILNTERSSNVLEKGIDNEENFEFTDSNEIQLSQAQIENGRKTWTEASNVTHEMAHRLCEQLRLVLEPTIATKLKGDYRTGKRINMRRVIPFIASQFKKDKIWLRRTKPSRRKYHIALAVDDSKSMRPAKSLALAALALITRALSQLEVGEVGIWSFGSKVRKLHDLSQPFSDTCGTYVASHFGFDQDSTCIEEGLGVVIESLTKAALQEKALKSEYPRQLAFVVSDGKFDSGLRPRMARWMRVAKERRQLIALIIVEPQNGESILELKQVTFGSGTSGMKVSRYLDDYPFPYYIVLRDMQVLPEVLADGLRQWFELIVNEDRQ